MCVFSSVPLFVSFSSRILSFLSVFFLSLIPVQDSLSFFFNNQTFAAFVVFRLSPSRWMSDIGPGSLLLCSYFIKSIFLSRQIYVAYFTLWHSSSLQMQYQLNFSHTNSAILQLLLDEDSPCSHHIHHSLQPGSHLCSQINWCSVHRVKVSMLEKATNGPVKNKPIIKNHHTKLHPDCIEHQFALYYIQML